MEENEGLVQSSPPPEQVILKQITEERMELYRNVLPPRGGDNIPISMMRTDIDDSVPTEEEVEWAVRRLRGHRSRGPYRMCAEHLWEWLCEHQVGEA